MVLTMRRRLPSLALVLALAIPLPALAAPGSALSQIELSKAFGPPGTVTKVTGSGFGNNARVTITVDDVKVARPHTNGSGVFSVKITIPPSTPPGDQVVKAVQGPNAAQALFTVRTDWPMYRFDVGHAGVNPYENVLSAANVGDLQQAWKADTHTPVLGSSPAVVDGIVYVMGSEAGVGVSRVYAFDASSGSLVWQSDETTGGQNSSVAIGFGHAFVMGYHEIFGIDLATGDMDWTKTTVSGVGSSPTLANGLLYVQADKVYALNPSNGSTVWAKDLGSSGSEAIAVVDGVAYVALTTLGVFALDATTGAVLWHGITPANTEDSPSVSGTQVFMASSEPGVGHITAMDASSGETQWTTDLPENASTTPVVSQGLVFVGGGTRVSALEADTGDVLWSQTVAEDDIVNSLGEANGVLFAGSFDDHLYALDVETGNVLWSYQTGDHVVSSAAIVDGSVYVGSVDRHLYAFRLPSA